jgi:ubiquinone/menaquinone biosynthesis C-methylase UbiE
MVQQLQCPPDKTLEHRKQCEVEFHNRREVDRRELGRDQFEERYSNKKWYSITRTSEAYIENWLRQNCQGARALDYCCGLGDMSVRLAKHGAYVCGIDISDESVETSRQRMESAGFADRSNIQVMDAEKLTFPDSTFDVIICSGVLHHLDLQHAYPQLSRVLKPGGKILCIEALGHNPIIQTYRRLTPHLRTSWEVDHILKMKDLKLARSYFDGVDVRYFHLFSVATALLRKTPLFSPALSLMEMVDNVLMRIPGVQLMAWQMVFELSKPIRDSQRRTSTAA